MASKAYEVAAEEFQRIIENSNSYAECCRKIGYSDKGRHGPDQIKKRCVELCINTDHFSMTAAAHKTSQKYSLDEILVENSQYKNIARLKIRLINEGKLEYTCAICGNNGFWNNQPLTLTLDHINGKHLDHRIENLRFLCPNCHSQTETFSGKNKTTTS